MSQTENLPHPGEDAPTHSAALQAANDRLLALRAEWVAGGWSLVAGKERVAGCRLPAADEERVAGCRLPVAGEDVPATGDGHRPLAPSTLADLVAALPPHLGWESDRLVASCWSLAAGGEAVAGRRSLAAGEELVVGRWSLAAGEEASVTGDGPPTTRDGPPATGHWQPVTNNQPPATSNQRPATIPLHPTVALALLREERVAEGRLWLLLRALDSEGRGWWARGEITAVLTDPASPTALCTPRYLRQLLAAGEGLFWRQDKQGKVWLRGQAKVAASLGLRRLNGRAVELPLSVLFQPIGELRAHLYASFHSGRGEEAGPISRETLRDLSGVSPRSQQSHEKRARVEARPCLAVGPAGTAVAVEEYAWQHGPAAFSFTDTRGRFGGPGQVHQARRLPNRYRGPHPTGGRARRLNRQLAGLCHQGDAGNGRCAERGERRYYGDGATAARGWAGQGGQTWVYWPAPQRTRGGLLLWQELAPGVG